MYIETTMDNPEHVFNARRDFIISIWKKIGEQKIDVVINMLNKHQELPIYAVAQSEGVSIYG